jgi:hypothetical protein
MRYFTLTEAEALIPAMERLMGEVRELKSRIEAKTNAWRAAPSRNDADRAVAQGQVDFLISQINARLDEVVLLGCQPKDVDMGLVDFPARVDGREVNLCWRLGETRIEYWHGLEEGFSGRKPLNVSGRPIR